MASGDQLEKGHIHLASGEYEKAVKAFKSAIKEAEDSEAYFGMAESASALAKYSVNEIAGWYRKAIDLDPGNIFYRTSYAEFCLENGIFNAAEEQYLSVADLDRDNAHIYFADFAASFAKWAIEFPERTGMEPDEISRKSLTYSLKALNMTDEEAVRLLKEA
jgi:tetratricopeptide (TPR) repeat protein